MWCHLCFLSFRRASLLAEWFIQTPYLLPPPDRGTIQIYRKQGRTWDYCQAKWNSDGGQWPLCPAVTKRWRTDGLAGIFKASHAGRYLFTSCATIYDDLAVLMGGCLVWRRVMIELPLWLGYGWGGRDISVSGTVSWLNALPGPDSDWTYSFCVEVLEAAKFDIKFFCHVFDFRIRTFFQ